MTSPATGADGAADLPDYAPIPRSALRPWTHFICGHLGRLATRDDVTVHQQYIADIEASAREALATVDPIPFYMRYGDNAWAGVKANLDTVTERAAAPIVAKYTGVLAAADIEIFTYTTTFQIMQSLRLDTGLGVSRPVNPRPECPRADGGPGALPGAECSLEGQDYQNRPAQERLTMNGGCTRLDRIPDAIPSSWGYEGCLAQGRRDWVHLRICQECGHVGCCDNSPGRPATAHFRLAGNPVVRWYEPGENWYWCHLDRLVFEVEGARRHRRTCDGSGCTDVDV